MGCKTETITDVHDLTVNALIRLTVDKTGKLIYILSVNEYMPTLGQVVGHLGPPEFFEAWDMPRDVLQVNGDNSDYYVANVYYPKQGMALDVSAESRDIGFIKPDMRINGIHYFEPGELLTYFAARYGCVGRTDEAENSCRKDIAKYFHAWIGFGSIHAILVPPGQGKTFNRLTHLYSKSRTSSREAARSTSQ
ncbi:MAG TPA: hypothetical protein VLX61_07845 [Anaerolineales bacterium]|nr:hypothetical protein [Anaerolineales bacterium]